MSHQFARIRRIEFFNFKALSRYTLKLSETNILVGPNNSGKSTIIGALRTLDAAVRSARARPPTRVYVGERSVIGYRIPVDSVPISLENVQTDYNGDDSRVQFYLSNGNDLTLLFPSDGGCILIPNTQNGEITKTSQFRRDFLIDLIVVPVLGPVEHNERLRDRATVVSAISTSRASRHFRSYWHFNSDGFSQFADLIARTWPGMKISAPELSTQTGDLTMFCLEGRMTRELYWVGFGFQVWCQLLTHLFRAGEGSLAIVDEPEVYLHPDVQRQLLGIIRDTGADVLLGTHSSEIIAEADPSEIIMVDKRRNAAERLKNIAGVQKALDSVGSAQNLTLTALAKSRRIVFVEGLDDFRLLRRFARKIGMQELSSGTGLTPLKSGGFGSWQKITTLADGIAEALGAPLMIGAVYDRDFFCDENILDVLNELASSLRIGIVLERKEIENYLLVPTALDRAIVRAYNSRRERDPISRVEGVDSAELLNAITAEMKDEVLSQLMARRHDYLAHTGVDKSRLYKDVFSNFDARWSDLESRLTLVPGKSVLAILRDQVQNKHGVTLTEARIVEAMSRADIPDDMERVLNALESFRTAAG